MSQFQGFGGLVHPTRLTSVNYWFFSLNTFILSANDEWYSLITDTVIYICFEFEEKSTIYFSNYDGFVVCMCGTCEAQYLHKGQEPLL